MKDLPKISIVIPSYNQAEYLEEALESVFTQSYSNLEVVVMDGGSTDGSREIIKKYADRLQYWQSQADEGQSAAINAGILHCTGDIVAWLNSDDYYLPDAFENVIHAYKRNPEAAFYFGEGFRVDAKRNKKGDFYNTKPHEFNRDALILGLNYILQPATFINSKFIERENFLNKSLSYGMDTDLWIRLSQKAEPVFIAKHLAASREYENTKTSTGSFSRIEELRQIAEKYSDKQITPGVICYFLDTLNNSLDLYPDLFPNHYREAILKFWGETAQLMTLFGASCEGIPSDLGQGDK